ncbi:MAG TPA: hypothetical protein VLZ83_03180 [Edaphocola sp.]|nr:hypothetical protein [Edaphocola sp.]
MKNIIIGIAVLSLSLLSCNKYRNNQYSTWYVNGEEFKTNEVKITMGPEETYILSTIKNNLKNNFGLSFYNKPVLGIYKIRVGYDYNYAFLDIFYNSKYYYPLDTNAFILVENNNNNKLKFTLKDTWFHYYYDKNDSVLVHGVFNEP